MLYTCGCYCGAMKCACGLCINLFIISKVCAIGISSYLLLDSLRGVCLVVKMGFVNFVKVMQ